MNTKLRILHAPEDVGGHAYGLSRAERELGLRSDVAVLGEGRFGYGADLRYDPERTPWSRLASRVRLLRHALRDYDVIHFNFGQSFVPLQAAGIGFNDLPLIKRAGKTVLVTFQGCDVRPAASCFCRRASCRREDRCRQPNARRFIRDADRIFHLNPDLGQWLPGSRFLAYANVDPWAIAPTPPLGEHDEIVVMHAPTDRDVKGTAYVQAAVDELRNEGLAIRLVLIEGVPRSEVLRRLCEADVVIDQMLIGWYGGFAVEAMALAKPVVCHIGEDNPFGYELPIVRASPPTLVERLRELAADRDARARIGLASRTFVERHHDPRAIAAEVLEGLLDEQPGADVRG
ncbi:MAG: hypothetical protein DLM63_07780 [Solirubrobacterales bacterium]|nr:MAG: hypothetical protein DLM63_07780 [Solirubrobacterales bacterium]